MASDRAYLEFILEQLSALDGVSYRAMMGEFLLYYRDKIFGGIYDDRLLVKIVPASLQYMPEAEREFPYDGGREMLLVDNVDSRDFLCGLVSAMYDELPFPKPRKRKTVNT